MEPPKSHKPTVLPSLALEKNSYLPPYDTIQVHDQPLHLRAHPEIQCRPLTQIVEYFSHWMGQAQSTILGLVPNNFMEFYKVTEDLGLVVHHQKLTISYRNE